MISHDDIKRANNVELGDDMFELGLAERIPKNVNPYDN